MDIVQILEASCVPPLPEGDVGAAPPGGPRGPSQGPSVAARPDGGARVAAEAMFRAVVEASPDGMLLLDGAGHIVFANGLVESLCGYPAGELLGESVDVLVPERHRGDHVRLREGYTNAPSRRRMGLGRDLTVRHRDGTEIPVEIGLSSIDWRGQRMVLATVLDVSARKRLELDLRQAIAHMEEFTYVASHDLRSPLRGIADLVEWIKEDLGDHAPDTVRHNLTRVEDRVRRMERIIEDLLTYARAGRTTDIQTEIRPAELVAGILELQPRPPRLQVRVDVQAAPFFGARTPLETSLRNLISNAIEHHDRDQGLVEVLIDEAGSFCRFRVRDDGPGIPGAAQQRVFRLFQTATAAERKGSGLGLAVTKRLIDWHGGHITLDSEDGRRGATFSVYWPRFQRKDLDEQPAPLDPPHRG